MNPDDPLAALMALKHGTGGLPAGAPAPDDPLAQLMALKAPGHDYHAEYRSGALATRMQGANAREAANVKEESATQPGYLSRAATHLLNAGQGIPGVEAVEAAGGALGSQVTDHPMGYGESLQALRGETGKIGGTTAAGERVLGSIATLPFLPRSPVLGGAMLGAADQALSAEPDQSLAGRATHTALGAAGGALLGKGADMLITGGRAALATEPAKLLSRKMAERAASAKRLFGAALKEGQGKAGTQAVQKFLAEPDIAEKIAELQSTRPMQGVAADSPEMLDAVYKMLSDQAATVKKGLESVAPNRPNIGRFRGEDIKAAQQRLLDALEARGTQTTTETTTAPAVTTAPSRPTSLMDGIRAFNDRAAEAARRARGGASPNTNPFSSQPSAETFAQRQARELLERQGAEGVVSPPLRGAPPGERSLTETRTVETPAVMPSYRDAVVDFAQRSREMDMIRRAYDVARVKAAGTLPTAKNLTRTTEPAFAEVMGKAGVSAADRAAAEQGILGYTRKAILSKPLTLGRRALSGAPSLLREANTPQQQLIDILTKAGLASGNADLGGP